MSFVADDHEAIRRRLEELTAERNLALTGSSVPTSADETSDRAEDTAKSWYGMTANDTDYGG